MRRPACPGYLCVPYLPLFRRAVCIKGFWGRGEVRLSDLHRKLEIGSQVYPQSSDSCLNKPNTCPDLCSLPLLQAVPASSPLSWPCCGSQKSSIWLASWGNESLRAKLMLCMQPMIFFFFFFGLPQSEYLLFFCSLNCHPLYSSTQRDGTHLAKLF